MFGVPTWHTMMVFIVLSAFPPPWVTLVEVFREVDSFPLLG